MPVVVGGCSGQTTMVALLVSAETFVMYSTQFTSANRSRKQFANAALFLGFCLFVFHNRSKGHIISQRVVRRLRGCESLTGRTGTST